MDQINKTVDPSTVATPYGLDTAMARFVRDISEPGNVRPICEILS